MKIPQMMPWVGSAEYREIADCFKNNWITEGPKSRLFLEKLLEMIGAKYAVLASNGTLALFLGLKSLGIQPGDEVIVPDFTFIGSATAVELCGATPVFIDVNRSNFQIDIQKLPQLITKRTRAIMPVHMYGTMCDMTAIKKTAKKYSLKIIEDAAQAIGVHQGGQHAGTFGDIGCFSFFADKTITTGEGGLVVTNNKDIYENLLYIRNQGRLKSGTFIHPRVGYNLRMTDMQCAVGLVQLKKFPDIKKRKLEILATYQKLLKNVPEVTFFTPDPGAECIPFRVGILVEKAMQLGEFLVQKGIEPRTFFYPLHRQPAFNYLKQQKPAQKLTDDFFPNSVYGSEHGICLPVFPTLKKFQIAYIANSITEFFHEK